MEIEAELADRGHDIMDWHCGRMSSRRLLVLLAYPREHGPYADALREGGWTAQTKILAEIHKELALYRASKYVGGEGEYSPMVFVNPIDARKNAEDTKAEGEFRKRTEHKLFTGLGWTKGSE